MDRARARRFWPAWAVALVVCWAALAAAASALAPRTTLCVFKRLTGLPCPTCGTGRAMLLAARGDPLGAVLSNPLMVAIAALFVVETIARTAFGRSILPRAGAVRRLGLLVLAVAVALNWAYVLAFVG
jgi:hypothetical protein